MRWLRENWLDLLIFILIALVAAGIVLYLTGVNPFARPPAAVPAEAGPPAGAAPSLPTPVPPSPPPESAKAPEPVVTVMPLPQAPAESPPAPTEKEPKAAASPAPQPPAQSETPPSTGAFRVVVGAFANPENAAKLRQELVGKGYPARLEPSGSLTRVVVGPYTSEAEAKRVAGALAAYGAQVYRGQGAAPSASGTFYLQVGAFQREENALALAAKLRDMGLPVVLVKDGVYRVRVGPVAEGEKESVKARLEALGLEALEVR